MVFNKESDFENALIKLLSDSCGWEPEILRYKTEKELLQNWANILYENNRGIDRLNDYPLTEGEMQQISGVSYEYTYNGATHTGYLDGVADDENDNPGQLEFTYDDATDVITFNLNLFYAEDETPVTLTLNFSRNE